MQLESFREIPPKPLAWTLETRHNRNIDCSDSKHQKITTSIFAVSCELRLHLTHRNSLKCALEVLLIHFTHSQQREGSNLQQTDFGNSAHRHVLSNVFLSEQDFPIFISLKLTGNLQYSALFLSSFIKKCLYNGFIFMWRCAHTVWKFKPFHLPLQQPSLTNHSQSHEKLYWVNKKLLICLT